MTKKQLIQAIVILAILGASAAMKFMKVGQNRAVTEKERFEKILKEDRKALSGKSSSDASIYSALVRLAGEGDSFARSEALERAQSQSSLVRAGVANALGFFDDEKALANIKILLNDPEPSVRIKAIVGLGHKKSLVREELVSEVLKRENLTDDERGTALSTLVQISQTTESKQKALKELVVSVHKQATPKARAAAATQALAAAPRDPRVLEMLVEILKAGDIPDLESSGIRHLAAVGNPWLKENIFNLSMSQNAQTRLAVVQSLHEVCPVSRFEILEKVFEKDADINVRSAAFDELGYLRGDMSLHFLKKITESKKMRPEVLARLKSLLVEETLLMHSGSAPVVNYCKDASK
jgi:hypothetical protein